MKTVTLILLVLTILSLLLLIGGVIAYELGRKSSSEHEKKIGLGLIISGSILTVLFLIGTIVVHHHGKKSSKKQSNPVASSDITTDTDNPDSPSQ